MNDSRKKGRELSSEVGEEDRDTQVTRSSKILKQQVSEEGLNATRDR